jgi:prepilin-type processing-associated H-X9-DG protein
VPGEREEHRHRLDDRGGGDCWITNEPNPYLRIPVILDEYVKNRDVWNCPSGKSYNNFAINSGLPDWWTHFLDNPDLWCSRYICMSPYPPGWGGTVTDTAAQRLCGGGGDVAGFSSTGGSFGTNYASPHANRELKTAQMNDAAKWVVIGEAATNAERDTTNDYAYQFACKVPCNSPPNSCGADWVNCSWTQECQVAPNMGFDVDPQLRKNHPLTRPRHLGGMNMGFADGHAAWYASEAILFGGTAGNYLPAGNLFGNLQNCRYPLLSPSYVP